MSNLRRLILVAAISLAQAAGAAGQVGQVPAPVPAAPLAPVADAGGPRPAAAAVSSDYVIGPGDSLEISVWKEPNVSGTLPVRPDGMISLPLVGDIQASGLTPALLTASITDHLKKSIIDPLVTVTVLGVKSKNVFLIGEIGKPGELPLTPGLTPLQAIASAGGLTQFANGKRIYILRGTAAKQQKIPFDYKKAIRDGNLQGVTLLPGDTIVVP